MFLLSHVYDPNSYSKKEYLREDFSSSNLGKSIPSGGLYQLDEN